MLSFIRKDAPHIFNEQTKLSATFCNNIAAATVSLGVLKALIKNEGRLVSMLVGAVVGFLLHVFALKIEVAGEI